LAKPPAVPALRIIVADDDSGAQYVFPKLLSYLGHEVVAVAGTGRELIDQCRAQRPDLVISDIEMPDMDGIAAAEQICREMPIPVILVSGYHEEELIERAASCRQVMAYLIKPIETPHLQAAITLARRRSQQLQAATRRADDLEQALEDRTLIERATGVLMARAGLTEPEASCRLHQLASDRHQRQAEVAQTILAAEEAFRPQGAS
jgi:response regulator NasT